MGDRIKLAREPRALTVHALLECVYRTERFDSRESDAELRAMMQFLEFAALGVEHTIPRRFRAGDPATMLARQHCPQGRGRATPGEARLFALKPGANGTLSQRLAQSLEQVTREDWASLRRVEVASMHIKRSRRLITLI